MRLFELRICITAFIISIIFFTQQGHAQSYGLGFYSHEVVQDKRTTLDLNTGNAVRMKDNLAVTFDLSFIPGREIYFGYILRLVNSSNQNIDLVYDNQPDTRHFKIIVGERLTKIQFNIDDKLLYGQWNKFRINIDYKNDKITLFTGNKTYTESNVHLKQAGSYKLLFGANAYKQFQTTDVPPMKLRDVKVLQENKLVCHWPLSEFNGNIVNELVNQNNGTVTNPLWIKSRHRNWHVEKEMTVSGIASTAFDPAAGRIYIVTQDSLITWSESQVPQMKSYAYHSGEQELVPGDQSVFNNGSLYYIFADQKAVARYNFKGRKWDQHLKILFNYTNYGHINKFFSQSDSMLYTIGGYGQLIYKDSVKKYNPATRLWQDVNVKGDNFTPRYLAGLGTTASGDTAYIAGGYGSASGQQIVNPRNLYDMMRFTVKDGVFKKLFTLKTKGEDFVFANSLVIDQKSKTYYGLIFPQHKYNSNLQLIKGSLDNPAYKLVGDTIPYLFHDTHSFADLYYCPRTAKFLAVTVFKDNDQTKIKIYSLLSPPEPQSSGFIASNGPGKIWVIVIGLTALIIIFLSGKKMTAKKEGVKSPVPVPPAKIFQPVPEVITAGNENRFIDSPNKNAIFLFGDLQLFTADGTEITKYFTPLLKELFLVVLLYSTKWGRGVSSEKLNEILWFDKSEKSARNNRSVNIAKLKALLDKMGQCHLSKDTGYWKIEIDNNLIFVDYQEYLNIVSNKNRLDKHKITQLTSITQRGNFLSNIEYEWLDTFKSDVSNEIIDTYLQFAGATKIADDPEFLIKLANDIFYFDPVNEEAMVLKCKTLSYLGKHSLAKTTFENFNKEYKVIYGENFEKDFHAVLT